MCVQGCACIIVCGTRKTSSCVHVYVRVHQRVCVRTALCACADQARAWMCVCVFVFCVCAFVFMSLSVK